MSATFNIYECVFFLTLFLALVKLSGCLLCIYHSHCWTLFRPGGTGFNLTLCRPIAAMSVQNIIFEVLNIKLCLLKKVSTPPNHK